MARNMPISADGFSLLESGREAHYYANFESILSSTIDNGGPEPGPLELWAEWLAGNSHEPHKPESPSQPIAKTNLDRANEHEQ